MRTNWMNIYAIVRREFLERVRKKSFLVSTLITPLIFGALMFLPAFLQIVQTGKPVDLLIIDRTGWAGKNVIAADARAKGQPSTLEGQAARGSKNAATLKMAPQDSDLEKIKMEIGDGKVDGLLLLENDPAKELKATYYGQNVSNPQLFQMLDDRLNAALMEHRIESLGLDKNLAEKLKGSAAFETVKVEKGGKTRKGSIMDFVLPIMLALVIYMMIIMYGVAIMNGVLEEKNNKVVEVILSAARPFELMMGKIAGIAAVGLLQYGIWFALGAGLYLSNPMNFQSYLEGPIVKPLQLVLLVLYFLLGFIFYSSLYAAVGATCTTQQETQQWQMPITFGLVIPFVLMMPTLQTPNAPWVVFLSLFPVSSPITMLLRTGAVEVPYWQLAASLALLALGTIVVAWAAAKIYRVGILMTGKRPSIPEVLRWIRQA
ncbi:MAG: ABC transporter permease [Acidobacteria bacterium]|nr:ABC transporter permease [Acidobacteriota bacterium]